jgi:hypothetical protein
LYASPFLTILQERDNLLPAFLKVFLIKASSKSASSQIIVPALTTATHNSGFPLPEPIRTPIGFLVIDNCGKTLIHMWPVFPNDFDKTTRSDSN